MGQQQQQHDSSFRPQKASDKSKLPGFERELPFGCRESTIIRD